MNETARAAIVLGMRDGISIAATSDRRGAVPVETSEEAFAALTRRNVDSAYRLAWAILGDTGDADDATQDAFDRAWRARMSLRDPARFDAWFGRILVNVCRERLRQRTRSPIRQLDQTAEPAIADASQQTSNRDAISRALACLDADHRIVIVLRYWADLPVDEIAARLRVPSGTVKSRLHSALRSMRPRLEDAR
ncbi:MAG: RNA polymerase sigma factor [Candidatus Limnocylindrales bacterium]